MPNAYHVRKAVNESERMQLLETLLQIEVYSCNLTIVSFFFFFSLLLKQYVFPCLFICFLYFQLVIFNIIILLFKPQIKDTQHVGGKKVV